MSSMEEYGSESDEPYHDWHPNNEQSYPEFDPEFSTTEVVERPEQGELFRLLSGIVGNRKFANTFMANQILEAVWPSVTAGKLTKVQGAMLFGINNRALNPVNETITTQAQSEVLSDPK